MDLRLSLKKKWFDLTKEGIKLEDYREINEYWIKRLCDKSIWSVDTLSGISFTFKKFDNNIMTLGYPSNSNTERIIKLEHKGIEIREGKPEWGAESGKLYFVIKHGEIIK